MNTNKKICKPLDTSLLTAKFCPGPLLYIPMHEYQLSLILVILMCESFVISIQFGLKTLLVFFFWPRVSILIRCILCFTNA